MHPALTDFKGLVSSIIAKTENNQLPNKRAICGHCGHWSVIPITLLCMFVNLSRVKQGSGPKGAEVL